MKINKILLGLALVAGGLFTSCDTDNVGTKYNVYTRKRKQSMGKSNRNM